MTFERVILDRLANVRQTGRDTYTADCPGHESRSHASLAVRIHGDRILIHDHGGCLTAEVLNAIGLTMSDLFEPRADRHQPRAPRWSGPHPADALRALAFEVQLVGIVAGDVSQGKALDPDDLSRLHVAIGRIATAAEVCCGR